jgi:hypothetical protein
MDAVSDRFGAGGLNCWQSSVSTASKMSTICRLP